MTQKNLLNTSFAKFQCFDKKMTNSMFFHPITLIKAKYECQEEQKVRNWKFHINTVKDLSSASNKRVITRPFWKVINFIFSQSMFLY